MAGPDDSDEVREVTERVEQAREEAIEAARAGQWVAPAPYELLFHPDHMLNADSPHPYGEPGRPISRHAPFYVGFVGGLGVLTALLIGIALRQVSSVLVIILVSFFLAVGLNPVVEFLMHRGFRRPWAVLVVSLGVLGVVAVFVVSLIPVLQDQITALIDNVPAYLDEFRQKQWVKDIDEKYDVIGTIQDKVQNADFAQTAFGSIFSVGLAVLNALFNAFLIFVLTLYLLAALPKLKQSAYQLAPASRRMRVTYLGDEILRQVGGYVAGQFLVAVCAGSRRSLPRDRRARKVRRRTGSGGRHPRPDPVDRCDDRSFGRHLDRLRQWHRDGDRLLDLLRCLSAVRELRALPPHHAVVGRRTGRAHRDRGADRRRADGGRGSHPGHPDRSRHLAPGP